MRRTIMAFCVLALVLAACGGADSDSPSTDAPAETGASDSETPDPTEPSDGGDDESPEDSGSSGLPSGGTGTVTVASETIESSTVLNCIIDPQFDPQPGDLDLTATLGQGIDALFLEFATVDLPMGPDSVPYAQIRASMQLTDSSGTRQLYEDVVYVQGEDGSWYEDADGAAGFTIARGDTPETAPVDFSAWQLDGDQASGTVILDAGSGPVEVTYDLEVADPVDCSL